MAPMKNIQRKWIWERTDPVRASEPKPTRLRWRQKPVFAKCACGESMQPTQEVCTRCKMRKSDKLGSRMGLGNQERFLGVEIFYRANFGYQAEYAGFQDNVVRAYEEQ
jgi:hypothetical protein